MFPGGGRPTLGALQHNHRPPWAGGLSSGIALFARMRRVSKTRLPRGVTLPRPKELHNCKVWQADSSPFSSVIALRRGQSRLSRAQAATAVANTLTVAAHAFFHRGQCNSENHVSMPKPLGRRDLSPSRRSTRRWRWPRHRAVAQSRPDSAPASFSKHRRTLSAGSVQTPGPTKH